MSNLQIQWTETELLETDAIVEPLVVAGRLCHGGFDADGTYHSPRTRFRAPAIEAWQAAHREQFGTEMLGVPLETWPRTFPNVAQAKLLLRGGCARVGDLHAHAHRDRRGLRGDDPIRDRLGSAALLRREHRRDGDRAP